MVLVKFIRVNALSKGKRAKSLYRFVVCEGVRTSGVVVGTGKRIGIRYCSAAA